MGSGKSIAAERHHQACLEAAAAADDDAPAPVFLRAEDSLPSLQRAVEAEATEVGEVRRLARMSWLTVSTRWGISQLRSC